ncbi:bacteriocin-type signal sequence-containing protein [Myxococcus fulvus]|uniref:Bacteriocin-type signal sequence-containing protein n=1 Tax=Myxococcus fulvus TaxID=33 RepID=A0A511T1S6_MYXFU|nr:hypothetical protein [Myxococcus fulvus]GEN08096.1 hypothetical protein MFU01_31330 [Myxococcus fulvus]SEU23045.1 bacteriocin-type signal sequence-containing protein [Myxococcus fulvus]
MKLFGKFESLDDSKFQTLENEELEAVTGGKAAPAGCTLDTFTVTPRGGSNDGDDSYSGECG